MQDYTMMTKHNSDPVQQGWFFWDETWSNAHGPFEAEEEAREGLKKYAIEELGIDIPSSDNVI